MISAYWNDAEYRFWGCFETVVLMDDGCLADGFCINLYWFAIQVVTGK